MKVRFLVFIVGATLLLAPAVAHAGMNFGKDERIHWLIDVDITSQEGEPLFLGYKTTTQFFIAGLYVHDDGYVFGLRSDHDKYVRTSPEELAKFQEAGLLPDPLPPYELSTLDYIFGYSLWIILPIMVIAFVVGDVRKRRAAAAAGGGAPPAA